MPITAPSPALVFAIIGAECTGKSTLAAELAQAIGALTDQASVWVPEYLREWCELHQRTPNPDEQTDIAQQQARRIDAACADHAVVIADTTPLMTAIYHRQIFGDCSLEADALRWHRRCTLTLLTALDLPWLEDGLQRDGPQVREPVDNLARELLMGAGLAFTVVSGSGPARLESALDALSPHLRWRARQGSGLFTRLAQRDASHQRATTRWSCTECDQPECEAACRLARRAVLAKAC